MKKANLIIGILMIAIAVVVISISAGYPRAEAYGTGAPGPGLWPICISAVIIAMSVILIIKSLRIKPENDQKLVFIDTPHLRVYVSMAVLVVYFLLLKPVGFLLPTLLLVTFFVYWFSKKADPSYKAKKAKSEFGKKVYEVLNIADGYRQSRPLWLCFVIGLITTLAVYFIFKLGLNVPMNFGLLYI